MRHPPGDGIDPKLVVRELRERFVRNADDSVIASIISTWLENQSSRPPDSVLPLRIARLLVDKGVLKSAAIETVIRNRATDFASVVEASDHDEFRRFAEMIASGKINSAKPSTKVPRAAARPKVSPKRRHDLGRIYKPIHTGQIEKDFGRARFDRLLAPWASEFPLRTCIDGIVTGDRVGIRQLEDWFGRDRKLFPKKLPKVKAGRTTLYGYEALAECFSSFLADERVARRWPRDPTIRGDMVATLVHYASDIESVRAKRALLKVLEPHGIRGARSFFAALRG